jgi:hypothetical protein
MLVVLPVCLHDCGFNCIVGNQSSINKSWFNSVMFIRMYHFALEIGKKCFHAIIFLRLFIIFVGCCN